MRHAPLVLLLSWTCVLSAAEAKPADPVAPAPVAPATAPAATAPAATAPAPAAHQPDPTAAIVAEGRYLYRQRDLDALVLVASRHAKARFSKTDEDRVREALANALLAREPFLAAVAALPGSFSGPERDALILDLLDYQAEPAKAPTVAPAAPAPGGEPAAGAATAPPVAKPAGASDKPDPAAPVLIRLPELRLTRTLSGVGKRQLAVTIALFFRDPALAQKLQARAPLVQDAILGYVQAMPPAQFVEPNQLTLKDGITAAIIAKLPDFPPDAVLIPGLEASAGDAADAPAKPAP